MRSAEIPWVRVLIPSADPTGLRLNVGPGLGAGRLSGSVRPGSTLGAGTLGTFVLGGGTLPARSWVDVSSRTTTLTMWRGMAGGSSGLLSGDVGTLTATVLADHPALAQVRPGTPIQAGVGGALWWTGTVQRLGQDVSPHTGPRRVVINAVDAVASFAAVTIPQLPSTRFYSPAGDPVSVCDEPQARTDPIFGMVPSRFDRIMEYLPAIAWTKTPAAGPLRNSYWGAVTQYGGLGEPRTAAEVMDISCASIRAMWWITAAGTMTVAEDPPGGEPIAYLTDQPGGLSYSDIQADLGPDELVTRVRLTTRQLEPGSIGGYNAPIIEYFWEWADPTLVATWGDHRLDLDVNVEASGGYEDALGRWYAGPWYTPYNAAQRLRVTNITMPGAPDWDVSDVLAINYDGRTTTNRIHGIERTVTPLRGRSPQITTKYHLAERA